MKILKRVWIPIVFVIVLLVGGSTVTRLHGVFGSNPHLPGSGTADTIVQFNPKHVYDVFGPPGAVVTVNYLDADAQPRHADDVTLPWRYTIVTTLTAVSANVVAQGTTDTLGCRITVNGEVRDERLIEGHSAGSASQWCGGRARFSLRPS
jgi:hypothetical protein